MQRMKHKSHMTEKYGLCRKVGKDSFHPIESHLWAFDSGRFLYCWRLGSFWAGYLTWAFGALQDSSGCFCCCSCFGKSFWSAVRLSSCHSMVVCPGSTGLLLAENACQFRRTNSWPSWRALFQLTDRPGKRRSWWWSAGSILNYIR